MKTDGEMSLLRRISFELTVVPPFLCVLWYMHIDKKMLWSYILQHIQDSQSYRFAALQSEGSLLPQFVVQIVEVEAEGGRSLIERHVEV